MAPNRDFHDNLITASDKIIDTLRIIDGHGVPIGLVHDNGRLVGTVTDGDIRRGLLSGVALDAPVSKVMNTKPKRILVGVADTDILAVMREFSISFMPVVDEDDRIVGLKVLKDLLAVDEISLAEAPGEATAPLAPMDNPVVIMAGGEGRRLRPHTEDCPKPMVKVGGKPILETIVERFVRQGFTQLYVSVNYRREVIENYFEDGAKWRCAITYLREDKPLGTAGALSLLPDRPRHPIVVMNGDLITSINFRHLVDFHIQHKAPATMVVREYKFAVPYGVATLDGIHLTGIEEKPEKSYFVNAGIYVVDPDVLRERIPSDQSFTMPELFDTLLLSAKQGGNAMPVVFPLRERWIEVGNPDELERAKRDAG
jgi:dTDP-glucose pyrophosphorylase